MAIKQAAAVKAMEKASGGELFLPSLSEITGGWLALAATETGKKLVCAANSDCPFTALWKAVITTEVNGVQVSVMDLNPNNAAVTRRCVKWTAPSACGTKGLSVGFSDWLGTAGTVVAPLFAKKQIKPVLVEYNAADCTVLKRNFLEAIDAATWAVFETGYREGYGANASGLKTEEDLVKVLLYGYSMLSIDCSDKINLSIAGMTDLAVEQRYNEFPEEFREAIEASYLAAPITVGAETLHYTPEILRRAVLEYGEVIMHAQSIYNSYLKNTPWDIDFELYLQAKGRMLTPQEHYLVGNEIKRNKIKLTAIALNGAGEQAALTAELPLHAAIAEACDYRLSFSHAELFVEGLGKLAKTLKGRAYFKLESVLWLGALQCIAERSPELLTEMAAYAGLEVAEAGDLVPLTPVGKAYADAYVKLLNPETGDFAAKICTVLSEHEVVYREKITAIVGQYLKSL